MPLLQFYHPPGAFSAADKQAIASNLTANVYTRLPSFYVVVQFIPLTPENYFVGGISRNNFVRVVIEHIAYHNAPDTEANQSSKSVKDKIDAVIKPYVADRGLEWEFCVLFGQQHLWRMNGYDPPIVGEGDLAVWKEAGKPTARI